VNEIATLATSQNPLKKPWAAPLSLAACRMDKLGARKKKDKNYTEHCELSRAQNQIICMESLWQACHLYCNNKLK
jgi:ligand-binding sensor protein